MNLRFAHWQQWSPRWQVQSNVAFQSDEEVNNTFVRDDYQRRRQLGSRMSLSPHGAVVHGPPHVAEHDRALDVPGDRFVTARTVLPRVSAQTSALRVGRSSLYFQGSANFESSYDRRKPWPERPTRSCRARTPSGNRPTRRRPCVGGGP